MMKRIEIMRATVPIPQLHKTLCRIREAPLKAADRCHLPRPFSNDEDDNKDI